MCAETSVLRFPLLVCSVPNHPSRHTRVLTRCAESSCAETTVCRNIRVPKLFLAETSGTRQYLNIYRNDTFMCDCLGQLPLSNVRMECITACQKLFSCSQFKKAGQRNASVWRRYVEGISSSLRRPTGAMSSGYFTKLRN